MEIGDGGGGQRVKGAKSQGKTFKPKDKRRPGSEHSCGEKAKVKGGTE